VRPDLLRLRPCISASNHFIIIDKGKDVRVERVRVLLEETPMSLQL